MNLVYEETLLKKIIFTLYWSMVNFQYCVSVKCAQLSDSVILTSTLFQMLSPDRLLQNTEEHSLCSMVGPEKTAFLMEALKQDYVLHFHKMSR